MKIDKVLEFIRPNEEWVLRGDSYSGLEWLDKTTPKPTEDEIKAGQEKLNTLLYQDSRKAEYPPIGDQLDALWKGGDEAAKMLEKIQAIKAKYPKPL